MKAMRWIPLAVLLAAVWPAGPCRAEFLDPPEFRVQATGDAVYFLRNIKSRGLVEVRRARDLKLHWKVKIQGYDGLFSSFFLSPDGKHLAHVKENNIVNEINDVCVEVYGIGGYRDSYKVSELRNSLPKYRPAGGFLPVCEDPVYVWYSRVNDPVDDEIVIWLTPKKRVALSMTMHKVTFL